MVNVFKREKKGADTSETIKQAVSYFSIKLSYINPLFFYFTCSCDASSHAIVVMKYV